MSLANFEPSRHVQYVHNIPRFGHTNNIAHLASASTEDDYKDGVIALGILFGILAVLWTMTLVIFKFYYGTHRVGCAAGGNVVDVKRLKHDERLDKYQRKRRILRNWRVQTACLLAATAVLPTSMLLLRLGLHPLMESLLELQDINDQVDSHAYRGIEIATDLQRLYDNLQALQRSDLLSDEMTDAQFCPALLVEELDDAASSISRSTNTSNDDSRVLVLANNSTLDELIATLLPNFLPSKLRNTIQQGLDSVDSILDRYDLSSATNGLYQVTNATKAIDAGIDAMHSRDWIIKFVVVVLDVTIIFIGVGILMAKENVDVPAYQSFAAWILLPIFCSILVAAVTGTCIFSALAMVNADFCAGGGGNGGDASPLGTMREILVTNGFDSDSLPYQVFDYYGSDCLSHNPLQFMATIEATVAQTHGDVRDVYATLNSNDYSAILNACGDKRSIQVANATLALLEQDLSGLRGTVVALTDFTGCSTISPVLRRLFFGSTCTQSVEGLLFMYLSLLWISTLAFVVLSTRAALFNPVIRGRRTKRREKEFADYKEFMSKFYNTSNWQLDWIPDFEMVGASASEDDEHPDGPACDSGETRSTSTASPTHEDDHISNGNGTINEDGPTASVVPSIEAAPACMDDTENENDDDDSYDSTYSVDEFSRDDASAASFLSLANMKKRLESMRYLGITTSLSSKTTMTPRQPQQNDHDEIVSSFSSSSVLSKFMRRRGGPGKQQSMGGDVLGLYQPDHYHANEWNGSEDDDENDSIDGVLMTPPAMRYPMHLQPHHHAGTTSTTLRGGDAPDNTDSELEPLSPPEQVSSFDDDRHDSSNQRDPGTSFRRSAYRY